MSLEIAMEYIQEDELVEVHSCQYQTQKTVFKRNRPEKSLPPEISVGVVVALCFTVQIRSFCYPLFSRVTKVAISPSLAPLW